MNAPEDPYVAPGLIATLTPLPEAECWDLLASARLGRVGVVVDGRPEVLPANYVLDGETVLFRTAEGTMLDEAASNFVAFEVDRIDEETHEGWSILVHGRAEDISHALGANSERMRALPLITWAPGARHRWIHIRPDRITGRRLRVMPDSL
jgi:nitroimidazol reductase NimA-like FMN-containing flavoprotein (pyridoxamine 5'-phosphate oxidase superfamily)